MSRAVSWKRISTTFSHACRRSPRYVPGLPSALHRSHDSSSARSRTHARRTAWAGLGAQHRAPRVWYFHDALAWVCAPPRGRTIISQSPLLALAWCVRVRPPLALFLHTPVVPCPALQNSKDAKIFCLIHKMDLIQEDQRDIVSRTSCLPSQLKRLGCFAFARAPRAGLQGYQAEQGERPP